MKKSFSQIPVQSIAFRALGTLNTIEMPEPEGGQGMELLRKVRDAVFSLDDRLSVFKEESEISAVNRAAGEDRVTVSESTFSLVLNSVYYARMTGGLFDVTAGPLVRLWGIGKKGDFIPSDEEILEACELVNYQDIIFEGPSPFRIGLKMKGESLDLGGIAKGYAADLAVKMLKEGGAEEALLDFGGTVSAFGREREIGIRNPFNKVGLPLRKVLLRDASLVTSGTYERFFSKDGQRYHHILNPKTGYPSSEGIASVTLTGASAEELDALATSVILLGSEKGMKLAGSRGIKGLLVLEDGGIFLSKDFPAV